MMVRFERALFQQNRTIRFNVSKQQMMSTCGG
jgi:hypothetical protein